MTKREANKSKFIYALLWYVKSSEKHMSPKPKRADVWHPVNFSMVILKSIGIKIDIDVIKIFVVVTENCSL